MAATAVARICPVFKTLTGEPPPEPARLRVIGRLDLPAFCADDFPGFSLSQIEAGLTTPATRGRH